MDLLKDVTESKCFLPMGLQGHPKLFRIVISSCPEFPTSTLFLEEACAKSTPTHARHRHPLSARIALPIRRRLLAHRHNLTDPPARAPSTICRLLTDLPASPSPHPIVTPSPIHRHAPPRPSAIGAAASSPICRRRHHSLANPLPTPFPHTTASDPAAADPSSPRTPFPRADAADPSCTGSCDPLLLHNFHVY
uniref:Uncharacterized protein n=1 Tax=Leersia perrieri TaxID=77586 RepID=A0A0D9XBE7_9ORYZ